MDHIIVKESPEFLDDIIRMSRDAVDGELLDLDIFEHERTFILGAMRPRSGADNPLACLPVQQPLMLENFVCRPGLSFGERALVLSRLTEAAIGEAWRRGAGEVYFLSRDNPTRTFARRHRFTDLRDLGLRTYRLNLRETFGS